MDEQFSRYEDIEIDGKQVATLRMSRVPRMSQARLAQLTGISRGRIAQIELQGRISVRLRTATQLASALETSLDDLMAGDPSVSGGLVPHRAWGTPLGTELKGTVETIEPAREAGASTQPPANERERKERMLRDLIKLLETTWADPLLSADRLTTVAAFIDAGLKGL